MRRKDMIVIACVLNIALFMILFATSSSSDRGDICVDEEKQSAIPQIVATVHNPVIDEAESKEEPSVFEVSRQQSVPIDELDEVLEEYTKRRDLLTRPQGTISVAEPVRTTSPTTMEIEVIVKKGDVLSKIAKAHGVSVEAIMNYNKLTTTKLKIGQVLKICKTAPIAQSKEPAQREENKEFAYYVVQGGDNPWKIARKCKLDYAELLRLNNLDEESAKNLKIGQKLRIK